MSTVKSVKCNIILKIVGASVFMSTANEDSVVKIVGEVGALFCKHGKNQLVAKNVEAVKFVSMIKWNVDVGNVLVLHVVTTLRGKVAVRHAVVLKSVSTTSKEAYVLIARANQFGKQKANTGCRTCANKKTELLLWPLFCKHFSR